VIREEFYTREEEIKNVLSYLKYMERERRAENYAEHVMKDQDTNFNQLQKTIKASVLLMLYNLVESTLTNCLNEIHDSIKEAMVSYNNLTHPIQTLFLAYHIECMNQRGNSVGQAGIMRDLIFLLKEEGIVTITYQELSSAYGLYSGNLDGKKVQSVLGLYGVKAPLPVHQSFLEKIKTSRNKLAHGESSFEGIGQDMPLGQVDDYVSKTIEYMGKVIEEVEQFIKEEQYCRKIPPVKS
jgi:hypothetical protein